MFVCWQRARARAAEGDWFPRYRLHEHRTLCGLYYVFILFIDSREFLFSKVYILFMDNLTIIIIFSIKIALTVVLMFISAFPGPKLKKFFNVIGIFKG